MSSANGRPATRGGKAVLSQRGGKGKWGAQSPPTVGSPVPAQAASPVLPAAGKESVVSEVDAKHMHDRMLFLLTHMIGMTVELTVKNGSKYEGLFHTAFTEGDLEIVLRLVKVVSGKDKKENAPLVNQMIVLAKDCVAINVVGVDFVPHERTGADRSIEREGFKTDTDISRSGDIKERDLKKWAPEEHHSLGGIEDDLGDSHFGINSSSASWDQFAANEKLFGVRTDFDEELYTTRLDRSGADFKAREQYAIQIANEIQQTASSNVHMQEERGLAVDDSGLDEEDRYGAVVRNPLPPSNKYMPPAMRRQQELQQQKRPASAASQPPVRASPSPAQAPATVQAPADTKSVPQKTAAEVAQPAPSATIPTPTKTPEPATVSRSNSTKGSNGQFNLNELRTHNPVSALLNAATIQGSKHQQIPDNAMDAQYIEENMAQFAQKARSFANTDKDLVKQTKLGLTQRRTELFQKEKDDFAAELKQFGKDITKKLNNTPVPDDVKEIFGKKADHGATGDKSKESAAGTKAAEKTDKAAPTESKENKEKKADTETTTASADKSAATTGTTFKLNVKANVFKPNVNAAPFTPSFGGADKKAGASQGAPAVDKNLFFGKTVKKGRLPLEEAMSSPFKKGQTMPAPNSIAPTWPYGSRSFRHLFTVTNRYEDDMMYSQGMGGAQHGNGGGGYYAMGPYSYGPAGQYGGPPPMAMGSPSHMMPFMPNGGPVPFSQPPPPGMPHTGAGQGYPQVAPTSAPHYAPQGFTAGRTGMIPPSGMPIPMYHYPPNHGGPMMMRYPPEMMPPMGPNGMMMQQRPLNMDPQMMPYPPSGRESTNNEGDSTSP
ncbi:hypothetical protein EMPS_04886 [Entomortierella parvispora]|uniref:LsmAD domain-containing protein n=1 Tax=Entomortierella parvispora TaxID=205924 RepID=A0A9P3HA09_9FUNG|nr:hypothetical protein EMPS_04886 [Entomortierella parvispora]